MAIYMSRLHLPCLVTSCCLVLVAFLIAIEFSGVHMPVINLVAQAASVSVASPEISYTFEGNDVNIESSELDDRSWAVVRASGRAPRLPADHTLNSTQGHYVRVKGRGNATLTISDVITAATSCLRFAHYVTPRAFIEVHVGQEPVNTTRPVYVVRGRTNAQWQVTEIELNSTLGSTKISFRGHKDIASAEACLDDISVTLGSCKAKDSVADVPPAASSDLLPSSTALTKDGKTTGLQSDDAKNTQPIVSFTPFLSLQKLDNTPTVSRTKSSVEYTGVFSVSTFTEQSLGSPSRDPASIAGDTTSMVFQPIHSTFDGQSLHSSYFTSKSPGYEISESVSGFSQFSFTVVTEPDNGIISLPSTSKSMIFSLPQLSTTLANGVGVLPQESFTANALEITYFTSQSQSVGTNNLVSGEPDEYESDTKLSTETSDLLYENHTSSSFSTTIYRPLLKSMAPDDETLTSLSTPQITPKLPDWTRLDVTQGEFANITSFLAQTPLLAPSSTSTQPLSLATQLSFEPASKFQTDSTWRPSFSVWEDPTSFHFVGESSADSMPVHPSSHPNADNVSVGPLTFSFDVSVDNNAVSIQIEPSSVQIENTVISQQATTETFSSSVFSPTDTETLKPSSNVLSYGEIHSRTEPQPDISLFSMTLFSKDSTGFAGLLVSSTASAIDSLQSSIFTTVTADGKFHNSQTSPSKPRNTTEQITSTVQHNAALQMLDTTVSFKQASTYQTETIRSSLSTSEYVTSFHTVRSSSSDNLLVHQSDHPSVLTTLTFQTLMAGQGLSAHEGITGTPTQGRPETTTQVAATQGDDTEWAVPVVASLAAVVGLSLLIIAIVCLKLSRNRTRSWDGRDAEGENNITYRNGQQREVYSFPPGNRRTYAMSAHSREYPTLYTFDAKHNIQGKEEHDPRETKQFDMNLSRTNRAATSMAERYEMVDMGNVSEGQRTSSAAHNQQMLESPSQSSETIRVPVPKYEKYRPVHAAPKRPAPVAMETKGVKRQVKKSSSPHAQQRSSPKPPLHSLKSDNRQGHTITPMVKSSDTRTARDDFPKNQNLIQDDHGRTPAGSGGSNDASCHGNNTHGRQNDSREIRNSAETKGNGYISPDDTGNISSNDNSDEDEIADDLRNFKRNEKLALTKCLSFDDAQLSATSNNLATSNAKEPTRKISSTSDSAMVYLTVPDGEIRNMKTPYETVSNLDKIGNSANGSAFVMNFSEAVDENADDNTQAMPQHTRVKLESDPEADMESARSLHGNSEEVTHISHESTNTKPKDIQAATTKSDFILPIVSKAKAKILADREHRKLQSRRSSEPIGTDDEELATNSGHGEDGNSDRQSSVNSDSSRGQISDSFSPLNIPKSSNIPRIVLIKDCDAGGENKPYTDRDDRHSPVPANGRTRRIARANNPFMIEIDSPVANTSEKVRRSSAPSMAGRADAQQPSLGKDRMVRSASGDLLGMSHRSDTFGQAGSPRSWSSEFYDLLRRSSPDDPSSEERFKQMINERYDALFSNKYPGLSSVNKTEKRSSPSNLSPRMIKRLDAAKRRAPTEHQMNNSRPRRSGKNGFHFNLSDNGSDVDGNGFGHNYASPGSTRTASNFGQDLNAENQSEDSEADSDENWSTNFISESTNAFSSRASGNGVVNIARPSLAQGTDGIDSDLETSIPDIESSTPPMSTVLKNVLSNSSDSENGGGYHRKRRIPHLSKMKWESFEDQTETTQPNNTEYSQDSIARYRGLEDSRANHPGLMKWSVTQGKDSPKPGQKYSGISVPSRRQKNSSVELDGDVSLGNGREYFPGDVPGAADSLSLNLDNSQTEPLYESICSLPSGATPSPTGSPWPYPHLVPDLNIYDNIEDINASNSAVPSRDGRTHIPFSDKTKTQVTVGRHRIPPEKPLRQPGGKPTGDVGPRYSPASSSNLNLNQGNPDPEYLTTYGLNPITPEKDSNYSSMTVTPKTSQPNGPLYTAVRFPPYDVSGPEGENLFALSSTNVRNADDANSLVGANNRNDARSSDSHTGLHAGIKTQSDSTGASSIPVQHPEKPAFFLSANNPVLQHSSSDELTQSDSDTPSQRRSVRVPIEQITHRGSGDDEISTSAITKRHHKREKDLILVDNFTEDLQVSSV